MRAKPGVCTCLIWALSFFSLTRSGLADSLPPIKTVFLILMENHNWDTIFTTTNCPYIRYTLVPMASHCEQYYTPPGNHPSEPNYIWLEGGTNFGMLTDRKSG